MTMINNVKEITQMSNEELLALRDECLDEKEFSKMSNGWKMMNAMAARIYTQESQIRNLEKNQITDHNIALLEWAKKQLELEKIVLKVYNNQMIVVETKEGVQ